MMKAQRYEDMKMNCNGCSMETRTPSRYLDDLSSGVLYFSCENVRLDPFKDRSSANEECRATNRGRFDIVSILHGDMGEKVQYNI
eukprot:scaffold9684_cov194-Amphora_coffeaeformis.AAC.3